MQQFPDIPPNYTMDRQARMERLEKKLIEQGLYVKSIPLDETYREWGYFIVSIDDPFNLT